MILKQLRLKSNIKDIVTNCYIIEDEETKEAMVIDPANDVDKIVEMLNILKGKNLQNIRTNNYYIIKLILIFQQVGL